MEKTEDEFKMAGKSLLITAKVDGFRRGGICHSATETLHSVSEFVTSRVSHALVAGRKIQGDNTQPLGINLSLECLPINHRQSGKPVDTFQQQDIPLLGIRYQSQQLCSVSPGATGVLDVLRSDSPAMVGSELLQSVTARLASCSAVDARR